MNLQNNINHRFFSLLFTFGINYRALPRAESATKRANCCLSEFVSLHDGPRRLSPTARTWT